MGLTVPNDSLSTAIIRDLWRDSLRTAVAGGTIPDPFAAKRPAGSPLVSTSLPDRNRFYPHVIVGEASDVSRRIDLQAQHWQHTYAVSLDVVAESNTHLYAIRDALRGWIETNVTVLDAAGFVDAEIVSSTSATWDSTADVKKWRIVVRGYVYTAPEE